MKIRSLILSFFVIIGCTTVKNNAIDMQENKSERLLILTADDFGASTNINEGIRFAAEKKAITGISALTNFPESLAELKEISEKHPDIGIGVHFLKC